MSVSPSGQQVSGAKSIRVENAETGNDAAGAAPSADLLPAPFSTCAFDDLMTALAVMQMRQRHEQRVVSNQQSVAAAKAQEDAHARKIQKMHELAEDTFTQGLVEGVLEGASAVATAASALTQFDSDLKDIAASKAKAQSELEEGLRKEAKSLARNANLLSAASKGFTASSTLGGAFARREVELDRESMALADADVDRAKQASESASAESRRAADDIRETIAAVRQYLAAKTQLANAAVIRG